MPKFEISQVQWRVPWHAIDAEYAAKAEAEIHREMCEGHVLFRRSVVAVGYRQDSDDVLFYLGESEPIFAVVHLSYQRETRPEWPSTTLFTTLAEWIEHCLIPDADGLYK